MAIHEEEQEQEQEPAQEQQEQPQPQPLPLPQQQAGVNVYPDWMAMQAYYASRMVMPQYFNSGVASGHGPPPYMWGPQQHMMPPYAAFYPHGGVYAHPGVHLASSPLNIDSPAKSLGESGRDLLKKLKRLDGLGMSIGNGSGVGAEGGNNNGISHSWETAGSSQGSDGNTSEGGQGGRKRSREGSAILPELGKLPCTGADGASSLTGVALAAGGVLSGNPITELNLKNIPNAAANMTSSTVSLMPNETLPQNNRELKRERRKQSNRESARRSRLRKQAEAEELAVKVEFLNGENLSLRSEISKLTDSSEKLKLQNAKLMEELKKTQKGVVAEDPKKGSGLGSGSSLSTANLLSRVDNGSGCVVRNDGEGDSGAKLRQLLGSSPRGDGVAAGAG